MAVADLSVARSGGLHVLAARWQDFSRWWVAGLRDTLPAGWVGWVEGEAPARLVIRLEGNEVACRLGLSTGAVEARLPAVRFKEALDVWLAQLGIERERITVGPVLGSDVFLLRDLKVPKQAISALSKILDQEVLRRTPFQLADIWHAATSAVDGPSGDVLSLRHWIIRKDRAEGMLAELGMDASDIDFLATIDPNGEVAPVIVLRTIDNQDPPWARRAVKLLAIAALGLALLSVIAFEWCQSSVAADVETSLAQARQGIQGGPNGVNPAARLFAMKADIGILEIWDELSRVLPGSTFLTEVRISDGKVTVSGFSADAALLVRIIDKSPLFSKAILAAAITPDMTEHKDRFSISFQVRGGPAPRRSGNLRSSVS